MQEHPVQTVPELSGTPRNPAVAQPPPEVLAQRRRCVADGVGLSHYILMEGRRK